MDPCGKQCLGRDTRMEESRYGRSSFMMLTAALACPQIRRMDTDLTAGSSSPIPEVGTESYMGEKRVREAGWKDGEKVGEEK